MLAARRTRLWHDRAVTFCVWVGAVGLALSLDLFLVHASPGPLRAIEDSLEQQLRALDRVPAVVEDALTDAAESALESESESDRTPNDNDRGEAEEPPQEKTER